MSDNKFVKSEPVIAAHSGAAAVVYAGLTVLLDHLHASSVLTSTVPGSAAVVVVAFGLWLRGKVTPASHALTVLSAEVEHVAVEVAPEVRAAFAVAESIWPAQTQAVEQTVAKVVDGVAHNPYAAS